MAGANVKIGANSSEFQRQMREVTRQLKLVSSECGVASEKAKLFGNATEKLTVAQRELTAKIQAQNQMITLYKDRIKGINSEIQAQKQKQVELASKIDEATKKHKESVEATGKDSEESKKLKEELEQLKEEYARNENAIKSNNNKLVDSTTKMNKTEKSILNNKKALEETEEKLKAVKLDELAGKFEKVGNTASKIGGTLSTHVSLPLAGIGAAAIKVGMDFDQAMSGVQAVAGASDAQMQTLKDKALQWGETTSFSATEVAGAMDILGSRGMDANKILAATPSILSAASASGESLETSAEAVTGAMETFGYKANETAHIADVFAQAAADSDANIASLSEALSYAGGPAHAAKQSLEEVSAAIEIMSNNSIDGSTSGTTLRNIFTRLAKPTATASKMMKQYGFAAFDAQGKMLPLHQIITNLANSKKGLTDQQKQAFIANVFGQESLSGLLALMNSGGSKIDNMTNKLKNCNGASKQMAEIVQHNTKASWKQALGAMQTAGIKIEEDIAPSIYKVANVVTKLANAFSNLNPVTQQFILTVSGIAAATGPALKIFGKFSEGISKGIELVNKVKNFKLEKIVTGFTKIIEIGGKAANIVSTFSSKVLQGAKAAGSLAINLGKVAVNFEVMVVKSTLATVKTIAQTVATNALKVAQAALNLVMNMNPIGLVVIAITGLIAAIVLLWNKCDWFRNLCLGMFKTLKAGWKVLCNALKILWQGVIAYFKIQLYAYKTIFNAVSNGLKAIWSGLCNGLKFLWNALCNRIRYSWQISINNIKAIINGFRYLFTTVVNVIRSAWQSLGYSIRSIWNGVISEIKSAWYGILSPFRSVANSIGNIWQGIRSMFKLPHFTISGSLNPLNWSSEGLPKIGVDWYWKGGIFNSPTLLGVGDAFNGQGSNAEAVVPLDSMYRKIKDIVSSEMNSKEEYFVINNLMDSNLIAQATYKKINGKLVLDTRRIR